MKSEKGCPVLFRYKNVYRPAYSSRDKEKSCGDCANQYLQLHRPPRPRTARPPRPDQTRPDAAPRSTPTRYRHTIFALISVQIIWGNIKPTLEKIIYSNVSLEGYADWLILFIIFVTGQNLQQYNKN